MRVPAFVRRTFHVPFAAPGLVRLAWTATALLAAGLAAAVPARAEDRVFHRSVRLRVGETQQLGVWGGHRSDCITNVPVNAIQVVQAPQFGVLSQRQGVPYIAQNSISGTCQGARFLGTAMDYTARAPGTDTVALDPVFNNGVVHWVYSVTVLP